VDRLNNEIKTNVKRLRFDGIALYFLLLLTGFIAVPADGLAGNYTEPGNQPGPETAVKKRLEVAMEDAFEEAEEKVTEKAAQATRKKEEFKSERPDDGLGPTKVNFSIFVLDIDDIDDARQSFMANVFVKLRWKDPRLANPDGLSRELDLDDTWHPQIIIANRQGLISQSLPEIVTVEADGTVTYRQRYSGMFSQPMQLADFPFDRHPFNVHFISVAYSDKEVEFVPDTSPDDPSLVGGSMAKTLSLPNWKIVSFGARALPYQPIREFDTAGFVFQFVAERYVRYFFWQMILPLSVVVMMSWASFWIEPAQVGVRIGVATSSILTLIAQRFVLANLLPKLPYMTRMDFFTVGCTLLVLLALVGAVATSYLRTTNHGLIAKRIDLWARGIFPASFILLLAWFMYG
jgi:hypothetical protein